MDKYLIAFLFISMICLVWQACCDRTVECGIRPKEDKTNFLRTKRVVGGDESMVHSWPWLINFIDKADKRQYCSGSIINRHWMLTAAHCYIFLDKSGKRLSLPVSVYDYHVADHIYNITGPHEYKVEAHELYIHPQYKLADEKQPGEYDVALVKLEAPLNFTEHVQPICLPNNETSFPVGHSCALAGWGNVIDKEGYFRSTVLRETHVNLVSFKECNSNRSFNGAIPESFLCAGFLQGGTDGCFGDSGAPLQCSHNGTYTVIGLMSWGKGCAQPKFYGVYTNITRTLPFVEDVLKGAKKEVTAYYTQKNSKCHPIKTLLYELFTNGGRFTDVDLVRSLQLLPYQIIISKNTTLDDFCYVANAVNVDIRGLDSLKGVLTTFLRMADKLEVYKGLQTVARGRNVKVTDMAKYLNLTMTELLNPMNNITTILNRFDKARASSSKKCSYCNQ